MSITETASLPKKEPPMHAANSPQQKPSPRDSYLMQGELSELAITRAEMIAGMATVLLEQWAYADRGDAIRALLAAGHSVIDVFILVDEAIYEAKQRMVAEEISAP